MRDQTEVCLLSQGVIFQPLSAPLLSSLRFFRHPLPAAPSPFLTVRIPLTYMECEGLTQLTVEEMRAEEVGVCLPVRASGVAADRFLSAVRLTVPFGYGVSASSTISD